MVTVGVLSAGGRAEDAEVPTTRQSAPLGGAPRVPAASGSDASRSSSLLSASLVFGMAYYCCAAGRRMFSASPVFGTAMYASPVSGMAVLRGLSGHMDG